MLLGLDEPVWELGRNGSLLSSPLHLCLSCSSSGPPTTLREGPWPPPSAAESATPRPFAYYILGGRGDPDRIFRLLLAVYHPWNRYFLHIGADGSEDERRKLAGLVKSVAAIRYFANVDVMRKPDPLTYMGSTTVAETLHAVVVLLKVDGGWDWLITLSATNYPLLTQDGMLLYFLIHIFLMFYVCSREFDFSVALYIAIYKFL